MSFRRRSFTVNGVDWLGNPTPAETIVIPSWPERVWRRLTWRLRLRRWRTVSKIELKR